MGLDIVLACAPLLIPPDVPCIRRLAGNWKPGTTAPSNNLFLGRNRARGHRGTAFVYNRGDPAEYRFRDRKDDYDLFLARLHSAKGYRWAVAGTKRLWRRMLIPGGWRPSLSCFVRYVGSVGGERIARQKNVKSGASGQFWAHSRQMHLPPPPRVDDRLMVVH